MACFGALSLFAAVYTDLPFRNQKLGSGTKYIGTSSSEGPLEKKLCEVIFQLYLEKESLCLLCNLYLQSRHIAGKTVYIKNELNSTLDKNLYRTIMMTFSAQTNANQTQVLLLILSPFQIQATHHYHLVHMRKIFYPGWPKLDGGLFQAGACVSA
jgi:hypothetical protein